MDRDEIRGSRVRRAATITGAAAGVAAREATARAMVRTARPGNADARQAAASRRQLKSAHALVKVFAGMRGAAMKVGQTLSAVDLGMVPEEIRPEFQAILAQLQQDADPVPFRAMAKVIERDLGQKLSDVFADIDPEPVAAASIGQVHRATLHDERDVDRYAQMRGQEGFDELTLPAERFVLMRGVMLVIGLLGQLGAENTWFDIAREWLYGDPPTTDLGHAEAAFFGTRHVYTTGVAA